MGMRRVSRLLALAAVVMAGASAAYAQQTGEPYFTASPLSGQAPLTVKFCSSAGIDIDFGDGTSGGMGTAQNSDCPTPDAAFAAHTYQTPGTYRLAGFPCPGVHARQCGAAAERANTVTITVAGPKI